MAGIYIHIPYCKQACHYCNFHFSVSQKNKRAFLDALCTEIEMQKNFFSDVIPDSKPLDTLYLGGGTPSILENDELEKIFHHVFDYFSFKKDAEITIETNPDDLNTEKLAFLKDMPINRLSIGIQSFSHEDLVYMNRAHNPKQAIHSIQEAQKHGFHNITADLIYGTPGLSDEQWKKNLYTLVKMEVPHISAYSLTVEKKTALDVFIKKGVRDNVEEEQSARQFDIMCNILEQESYIHYEISNFGRKEFFSEHNVSYWNNEPYLGLGPSAHSFKPGIRQWNIANTCQYIDEIGQGKLPKETEILDINQQYNEYIMTGLRTQWGVEKSIIEKTFGAKYLQYARKQAQNHIKSGMMKESPTHLFISLQGRFFSDGIAADLFYL